MFSMQKWNFSLKLLKDFFLFEDSLVYNDQIAKGSPEVAINEIEENILENQEVWLIIVKIAKSA